MQSGPIPTHIALIGDGNRRWAKKHKVANLFFDGHWKGAEVLLDSVLAAAEMGIKVFTVYGFSTENWNRSEKEVNTLFEIYERFLRENCQNMVSRGVVFETIGDLSKLPSSLQQEVAITKEKTGQGDRITFVVALNYGARDEIKRAIQRIIDANVKKEEITEELVTRYLDTASYPDPDLLIRTSGELRLSNFLLWQHAYTEIHITDILWPDFKPKDLLYAVEQFQKRQRRQGK